MDESCGLHAVDKDLWTIRNLAAGVGGVGAVHSNKPHASVSGLGRSTHHARQLSDHMSKMSVTPILTIFSPFSVFHTKRVSRSPVETS